MKYFKKMKSLRLLLFAILSITFSTHAASFMVQSFLNPQVSSLVISNNIGWTNLNWVAQNNQQGQYLLGTNTAGNNITAPIATNTMTMNWLYYSNSTPVQWFGQTFPSSYVILTNNTVAASASTNDIIWQTPGTNNALNVFQDVSLPGDFYTGVAPEYGIGAAGTTNAIAYLQIVSQQFSLFGNTAVGAGSNIVNLTFSPIAAQPSSTGNPNYGIPGFVPGLEPNFGDKVWVVTYTNQISTVGAPTVYNTPVPRWMYPGANGMRLRNVYSGSSTNAVNINSITLQYWKP